MATRTAPLWIICCALIKIAATTPAAAFPFNSQVPAVARVNTPYNFQLSDSTFAPSSTNFSYSLSNQPAWLSIDSATRTLTGAPGQGDVGSSEFTLTAADSTGAAHMGCTLVVSQDTAPQLSGDISKQLAATANLSSSHPPVVTLLPATVFQFDFQQESFIDIVQRKLYYYATLSDHTPLPSWLKFDTTLLTFSGTAPSLSAFPQSWEILLIASDIPGFSATTASFTIAIGTEQLAFVPEEQDMNVTAGRHIAIPSLRDQLFRNGVRLPVAEWQGAKASSLPSWLSFDISTLAIEGNVPEDVKQQNFTVTVTDLLGNVATAIINLIPNNTTLFNGQIGMIVAEAGDTLRYHFDDALFTEVDLVLSVALPAGFEWLRFEPATRELVGTVPRTAEPATVKATLTAKSNDGDEDQSQIFTIDIKAIAATSPTHSSLTTRTLASSKLQRDVEKSAGIDEETEAAASLSQTAEHPPQITLNSLDLPSHPANRRSRWSKRFSRMSYASSIDPKRKSIRMVQRSDSVADNRPVDVKRQSFIHNRATAVKDRSRASVQSPLFAHGSRASSLHTRQPSRSANRSSAGSLRRTRRSKNGKSMLTTYSESSSLEPQPLDPRRSNTRKSKRLSQRVKSTFAPNFPRVMSQSIMITPDDDGEYTTTESSMNSNDWIEDERPDWLKDAHKPRHERDWVLTHEASPTPPPVRPESQPPSRSRLSTSPAESGALRPAWKDRLQEMSSSPLASNVQVIEPSSVSPNRKTGNHHHNRLSEPIDLVSADSMHKARPRLAQTKSRRPVSVEGAGLAPRATSGRAGTQKSDMSGPAFL
ncbi:hypothetical protein M409DRAFT_66380 [Zasmidium cellare ATCC 36951]|uniref:Dystroglycan-type cadherin-like domain-containing protein n=1 Tax=Zasmidium cellare ATCC 36951 TaxID=1080233 RepID=A0A6A6CIF5_ZASCE|nr:uncharacterized protein M409DRAFT_66380 [Zasmidium cellare ATCC 36951]KAF2166811.1 hypothetical protein M409DRAFT_66380 [Zasmidium cellare ATCC 36951]